MTDEEMSYRIGRDRAIRQLWRAYRKLVKKASTAHTFAFREETLRDADMVKRRLDQLRAEK